MFGKKNANKSKNSTKNCGAANRNVEASSESKANARSEKSSSNK